MPDRTEGEAVKAALASCWCTTTNAAGDEFVVRCSPEFCEDPDCLMKPSGDVSRGE